MSTRRRLVALAITAVVLYGAAPAVLDVLGAFDDLDEVKPWWWVAVLGAQAAGIVCFCDVQRLALHSRNWFGVVTSNVASGALGRVVPGGGAAAAALQYRMLVQAGESGAAAGTGLAAGSLLIFGTLAGLPLLALPAVLFGLNVPSTLLSASIVGIVLFFALFALGVALMRSDGAIEWVGRAITWVLAKVRRKHAPPEGLPDRLREQRNVVRRTLGTRWPEALAAALGRWLFDFLTLLAALEAVGAHPGLAITLLAYCAAQLLAQIPITPGGLGVVEAGLTGTLALAGVNAGQAAVATLAYRMASYWLQLPAGLVAFILHRRRYGSWSAEPREAGALEGSG